MTQDEVLQLLRTTPTSFDELPTDGKAIIANLVRPATSEGFTPQQQQLIDQWFLIADESALEAVAIHNNSSPFQVLPIYQEDSNLWLIPSIVFTDARPNETYSDLWTHLTRLKFYYRENLS